MNNGSSTGPFNILRGVRQGDPLSAYLFISCLEVFAISIHENKNIQGFLVDKEEIKLEVFADDVTAFLRKNDLSKFSSTVLICLVNVPDLK